MKKKSAFSLVELMVAVGIVSILAAVAMPNFTSVIKRARDAQRKSDIAAIQQALVLYRSDNSNYPCNTISLASDYIKKVPTPPTAHSATSSYTYTPKPSTGTSCSTTNPAISFVICSDKLESAVGGIPQGNAKDTTGAVCDSTKKTSEAGACNYYCLTSP